MSQTVEIREAVEIMSVVDRLILADHYEEEGHLELAASEREIAAYIQLKTYKPQISQIIKRICDFCGYRGRNITIQVADKVIIDGTAWDEGSVNKFHSLKIRHGLLVDALRLYEGFRGQREWSLSMEGAWEVLSKIEVVRGKISGLTLFIRPEIAPTIFPKK